MLGEHDVAVLKVEEAIRLNPNDAIAHYFLGSVLRRAGRFEEAIPHFDHAMRLSPRDIWITGMLTDRAFVLFALERFEEALEWAQRARLSPNPRTMTFAIFAAVLSKLERQEEARSAVASLMAHAPSMTCTKYRENLFGTPEVNVRLVEALSEAGLPD
jgi:adenylate cyclase